MGWRSPLLHLSTLMALALVEVGMAVTLGILLHLSSKNRGFVAIKEDVVISASAGGHDLSKIWNIGFLWTSLPSLIMVLFGLAWAAVVESLAEEAPMRELVRPEGSSMKKTLLLDYRRYLTFIRWRHAFKNHHTFLGICMLLTTVNTIVLLPLAARLFAPVDFRFDKPGTFVLKTSYNPSANISSVDYTSIFATVTAVRFHSGTWPAYTDGTHAYPAFAVPTTANLTQSSVNITAYGAELDCTQVTLYNISRLNSDPGSATISVSATDRGCDISFKGGVGAGSMTFLKTQSTMNCPQDAGLSRISFFSGLYSPSAPYLLDDLSVVSCKPSYNQQQGVLTAPPSLDSLTFHPQAQSSDARLVNWRGFEESMLSLSNIGDSSSPDFTSAFGELILGIARQNAPNSPLSHETLIASTAAAFSNVFVVFAQEHLFDSLAAEKTTSGFLTVSETRLTVVAWSAYVSIAILAVLAVLTILIIIYLAMHEPVFPEEPLGIIGYTSLLSESDAADRLLTEANDSPGYRGKFYEWLQHSYLLGSERCTLNRVDRTIDVHNLTAIQTGGNGHN